MTRQDDLPEGFVRFWARMGSEPNIEMAFDPRSAWVLMSAVQLAWRHPGLGDAMRENLWRLGHAIETAFRDDPEGARYAAQGWEIEYDGPASVTSEAQWRV